MNKTLSFVTKMSVESERRVKAIVSTSAIDSMGDTIIQSGISLTAYRRNPIVLFSHDTNMPVARCVDIGLINGSLTAVAEFPAKGEDADSDRVYSKIKAGLINAVSIGFSALEYVPIATGYKFVRSIMREFSFVSVPANTDALIIARNLARERHYIERQRRWY